MPLRVARAARREYSHHPSKVSYLHTCSSYSWPVPFYPSSSIVTISPDPGQYLQPASAVYLVFGHSRRPGAPHPVTWNLTTHTFMYNPRFAALRFSAGTHGV